MPMYDSYSVAPTTSYSAPPTTLGNLPPVATTTDPAAAGRQPQNYAAQGEEAFKAENYEGAIQALRHAIVDDPSNGGPVLLLGQALFATGQYEQAAGAIQEGLRLVNPDQWGAIVGNYASLYNTNDVFTRQVRALESAIAKNPGSPALRFLSGYEYGFLGYPKEAVAELDQVLKAAPQDQATKKLRDFFAPRIGTQFDKRAAAAFPPAT
jgi:tetratricopeptide (TPR) repeat protein